MQLERVSATRGLLQRLSTALLPRGIGPEQRRFHSLAATRPLIEELPNRGNHTIPGHHHGSRQLLRLWPGEAFPAEDGVAPKALSCPPSAESSILERCRTSPLPNPSDKTDVCR